MSGDFVIDLLQFGRPAANVSQFVRGHVAGVDPATGLQRNHLDARLRQRQRSHTTRRAGPDNHNIRLFQGSGHEWKPKYGGVWRISSEFGGAPIRR